MTAQLREKHGPSPFENYQELLALKALGDNIDEAQRKRIEELEALFHMDEDHVTPAAVAKIAKKPTSERTFKETCIWDAAIRKAGPVFQALPKPRKWDDRLVAEWISKPCRSQVRRPRPRSVRISQRRVSTSAAAGSGSRGDPRSTAGSESDPPRLGVVERQGLRNLIDQARRARLAAWKTCPSCKREQELEEFGRGCSHCKSCEAARLSAYRRRTEQQVAA